MKTESVERLRPFTTLHRELPDGIFHFHDAPPDLVRPALSEQYLHARPNGQPTMLWLVEKAKHYNGYLGGVFNGYDVRVDSICVTAAVGVDLARDIAADWPDTTVMEATALELAVVEGWEAMDSTEALWHADGNELLEGITPPARILTFWWD